MEETSPPPSPASRNCALKCALLFAAAVLILGACWYAWVVAREHEWLRVECLVAGIVGGLGATACLAGMMHYLDILGTAEGFRWYGRWLVGFVKRVILILQLATTGVSIAAALILIFGFKIPGAHATIG